MVPPLTPATSVMTRRPTLPASCSANHMSGVSGVAPGPLMMAPAPLAGVGMGTVKTSPPPQLMQPTRLARVSVKQRSPKKRSAMPAGWESAGLSWMSSTSPRAPMSESCSSTRLTTPAAPSVIQAFRSLPMARPVATWPPVASSSSWMAPLLAAAVKRCGSESAPRRVTASERGVKA